MLRYQMTALTLLSLSCFGARLMAQQTAKPTEGLQISGYIQLYHQVGQQDARLSVGTQREGDAESFSRLGVRRGRTKLSYTRGIATGVLQMDLTERGLGLKDAYIRLALPFLERSAIQAGVFDRPFGHEIGYSSSRRESPERSLITRTLFPDERDLGVMLSLKARDGSPWESLRLDAGLFSGQGIKSDVDSRMDFIGRLSGQHKFSPDLQIGLGLSLYYGSMYQTSPELYYMSGSGFTGEDKPEHVGGYARRSYVGIDAQLVWRHALGKTELRGEWITGQQPSSTTSSRSPNGNLHAGAMYLRPVSGGYALLTQGVGRTPLSLVAKYDWYDPNTALRGNEVGIMHSSEVDLAYQTLGLGAMYQLSEALRLTLYAEQVSNERSNRLSKYQSDRKDNRLTLALLYKF